MATTTSPSPAVRPRLIADLLGDGKVLQAARRLIEAEMRRQTAYAMDAGVGEPERTKRAAIWRASEDAGRAGDDLAEAARRAAQRLAEKEATR